MEKNSGIIKNTLRGVGGFISAEKKNLIEIGVGAALMGTGIYFMGNDTCETECAESDVANTVADAFEAAEAVQA